MSTTSSNRALDYAAAAPGGNGPLGPSASSHAATVARADRPLPLAGERESVLWGLPVVAWIKIGIVAVLMAALFRFNLARLWGKTNPFTGQSENWQHSMLLPLIGLYYLYVWRDDLLGVRPAQGSAAPAEKATPWTLVDLWGLAVGMGAAAVGVGCATAPDILLATARNVAGLPVPWAAVVIGAWTAGSGVFIFARRHTLGGPYMGRSLDAVARLLRTWLMLALFVWGLGFFVWVGSARAFALTRLALGALSLGGLVGVIALRGSDKIQSISRQLNAASAGWFGGFVMLFGILFSFWGIWPGQNDFFKDIGMVIALFGVTTLLAGWRVMRVAWFPIVFLLCAVPWPDQYYSKLALPLQYLAAKVAVFVLNTTGVMASQQGTKMVMAGFGDSLRTLNVAEACAGLRSLMTFVSVAGAIAFLSARPLWQKVVITASAVPIAITCNVMRVTGQGLLDHYVSQQWSQGFAHGFAGLVMLIPGFFLILLVLWILDHLFIDVVDDEDRVKRANAKRGTAVALAPAGGGAAAKLVNASAGERLTAPRGVPAAGSDVAAPTAPAAAARQQQVAKAPRPPAQAVPAQPTVARAAPARPAPATPAAPAARGDKPAVIQIPRKPTAAGSPAAAPPRPAPAGNAGASTSQKVSPAGAPGPGAAVRPAGSARPAAAGAAGAARPGAAPPAKGPTSTAPAKAAPAPAAAAPNSSKPKPPTASPAAPPPPQSHTNPPARVTEERP